MNQFLETFNVVTLLTLIITITGALVTITNPSSLSFKEYMELEIFLLGAVGIGRGLATIKGRA